MHEWNAKRWTELSNLVSTKKRWKKVDLRTQTDNAALDRNEIEWNSNETLQCFRMFHTCFVKQWKTLDAGCTWGHGGTGIRNSEVEIFVLFVEVELTWTWMFGWTSWGTGSGSFVEAELENFWKFLATEGPNNRLPKHPNTWFHFKKLIIMTISQTNDNQNERKYLF